jgi:hypothetical protein
MSVKGISARFSSLVRRTSLFDRLAAGPTAIGTTRSVRISSSGDGPPAGTLALMGLVVILVGGCASAPKPPSKPLDACAIFKEQPGWYKAAKKAERKWGTPIHVQLAIIQAESSFRHDARPPGRVSSAYGYSQAIDGTWDWYRQQTGNRRAKRTNFDHAVDFVGWYTDVSQRMLGIPKADGYRQYLAYHEGHRGFQRGTYRKKAWLVNVARRVDQQAKTYGSQLNGCRR